MTGTNEADWAYLLTLLGLPLAFTVVMAYLYIRTRRRGKERPPSDGRVDGE